MWPAPGPDGDDLLLKWKAPIRATGMQEHADNKENNFFSAYEKMETARKANLIDREEVRQRLDTWRTFVGQLHEATRKAVSFTEEISTVAANSQAKDLQHAEFLQKVRSEDDEDRARHESTPKAAQDLIARMKTLNLRPRTAAEVNPRANETELSQTQFDMRPLAPSGPAARTNPAHDDFDTAQVGADSAELLESLLEDSSSSHRARARGTDHSSKEAEVLPSNATHTAMRKAQKRQLTELPDDIHHDDLSEVDQMRSRPRRTTIEQSSSRRDASPKPPVPPPKRRILVPVTAAGNLTRKNPLPSRVRDRDNQTWVSPDGLGEDIVKYFQDASRKMATAKNNWKEFARLMKRQEKLAGQYCVQCNILSHAKHQCPLADQVEACSRCTRSGRACSKLIELDGELYLGWLPLPAEARFDAQWHEAAYWIPH
jgi:hypothetical protein